MRSNSVMTLLLVLGGAYLFGATGKSSAATNRSQLQPLPSGPPRPQLRASWATLPNGKTLYLDSARQYAAVIDVPGPQAALADEENVSEALRKRAEWLSLKVWSDPDSMPKELPFAAADRVKKPGRFWAMGQPQEKKSIQTGSFITRVFTREALKLGAEE